MRTKGAALSSSTPSREALRWAGSAARAACLGLGATVGAVADLGLAWVVVSRTLIDHDELVARPIDAPLQRWNEARVGDIAYYADLAASDSVPGRPLLLVHSINAGASAYEMRPLFNAYRERRPVYTLDLPGFGFSERSDRHYDVDLYVDTIRSFAQDVIGRERGPIDAVALSLGAEFVARAALEEPALFRSLALLSPSGLGRRGDAPREQPRTASGGDGFYRALSNPLWAQAFYDLLATRPSIRYFLSRSFTGKPDAALVEYDVATTHRPGARYAPLFFVSGRLFTRDILQTVYEKLHLPVLVVYDKDGFVSFDALPQLLAERPNWLSTRIVPTKGLPHFERLDETTAALDRFWAGLG